MYKPHRITITNQFQIRSQRISLKNYPRTSKNQTKQIHSIQRQPHKDKATNKNLIISLRWIRRFIWVKLKPSEVKTDLNFWGVGHKAIQT